MYINDRPLSDYGLEPVSSDGRTGFPAGSLVTALIPETSGAQIVSLELDRPREVRIRCRLRGDDDAGFFTNRDRVAELLQGALEVRFTDMATLEERILYCLFRELRMTAGPAPEWLSPNRELELVLFAGNPLYHDRYGSIVGDGDIAVGTASNFELVTELGGALTVPITLTLKDHRGNVVNQLKYDNAVAAGEWLEIRHGLFIIRRFTAIATYTNVYGGLDTAVSDFGFFEVSPDLADRQNSAWPTITVTAGAAVSVINKFRRAWR